MINDNLSLNIGSNIIINGEKFVVRGYIEFKDTDGARWIEYKLKAKGFKTKWLSVDTSNNEYAIYSEKIYSKEFSEKNIKSNGYEEIDSGFAKVVAYRGYIDVNLYSKVFYKEYEKNDEKLLISIENWEDEEEFSKGYYINKDDIEILDSEFNNIDNKHILHKINKHGTQNLNIGIITTIILIMTILIPISLIFYFSNNIDDSLSEFISSDSNFQYETSITSDLNQKKKADVYSTNKTIGETAKLIICALEGYIEDVQENKDDNTVVITTTDEMALIYLSEDSKVLVQVSSRQYAYSSRNTVYGGSHSTNSFFRNYYYSKWYSKDKIRYSKLSDGYINYKNSAVILDDNNKYKIYSDKMYSESIRQDSVNSRVSSGDGISSGK